MPNLYENRAQSSVDRVKLTVRVSVEAYQLVSELQQRHRRQTGKALPLWKVLDAAIRTYATNSET